MQGGHAGAFTCHQLCMDTLSLSRLGRSKGVLVKPFRIVEVAPEERLVGQSRRLNYFQLKLRCPDCPGSSLTDIHLGLLPQ